MSELKPYYDADGITIYHGSCEELIPSLGLINAVFTSPPYNTLGARIPSSPSGMWGESSGGAGFARDVNSDGYPDDLSEQEYQQQQCAVVDLLGKQLTTDGSLFYNHKCRWRDGAMLHPVVWLRTSLHLKEEIIWDRGVSMTLNARMFAPSEERILWFTRSKSGHKWHQPSGNAILSVWRVSPEQGKQKPHPVSFPLTLPLRAIMATTDEGDTVLDPYMGSGTTLLAAKQAKRRAIGIEREERFCAVAVQRLAQGVLL